jgi:hypothetical protein
MRFWDPVTIVVILLSCFIVPYTPSHFDPVALAHTEERTLCFGCVLRQLAAHICTVPNTDVDYGREHFDRSVAGASTVDSTLGVRVGICC